MPFGVEQIESWPAFKKRVGDSYTQQELATRKAVSFRGHADRNWALEPTLVRAMRNSIGSNAWPHTGTVLPELIEDFKQNCYGIRASIEHPTEEAEWEFLGRHHGLPTRILDWSSSPYVAAFFALADKSSAAYACVWVLSHRDVKWAKAGLEIKEFGDTTRFNVRAVEQRGVSMRCLEPELPIEISLENHLIRLDLNRNMREAALVDLDEMLINHRTLCRDLDGAARLSTIRFQLD